MTTQPSGIRPDDPALTARLYAHLAPWRRRLLILAGTWVAAVVVATTLGLRPELPLLLSVFVVLASTVWYAVDHFSALSLTVWPLVDGDFGTGSRGNDFRVTNLAARLDAANTRGEGRIELVRDLHTQLSGIIRERLYSKHGLVIEDEPKWSEGVMPPDLWTFLVSLPPPDLYKPAQLDQILRRIEQW